MEAVTPKRITVHCSATENGKPVSIERIRQWHKDRGWKDIGYHVVVDVDGSVSLGRPFVEQGAHVEGANEDNIGICLVGTDKFSDSQWRSLKRQLDNLMIAFNIDEWNLHTHREWPSAAKQGKTCPGFTTGQLCFWYYQSNWDAIRENLLNRSSK